MDGILRDWVEREAGGRIATVGGVSGGDMATAYCVELDDGRRRFVKTHTAPPVGFFGTEAEGLRWLAAADAAAVPTVLAVSDENPAALMLDWIDEGPRTAGDEAAFGRSLAALHGAGAPAFGRTDHRTTGSLALPNDPAETWTEFFAERRLRPLARIAADRGSLPDRDLARLEGVATDPGRWGAADEPPARLHGDLWAGNRLVDRDGVSWLIDPAAHGGHREFDLAMMRLFGGFGAAAFEAYAEVTPLAPGWERRVALHQLAPLVVHAIKFGGGYGAAVGDALDRLGA